MSGERVKDDALTPSQRQPLASRSAALMRRGLAEALTLQSSEAYYNRGFAKLYKESDYDGAIEDFTKAIEINPRFVDAYESRAIAKEENGDSDGAIEDYTKIVEMSPRADFLYYCRGCVKNRNMDWKGAINDLTKAIEIDPLHPRNCEYYTSRGSVKAENGDYDGAIEDFTKAIEVYPPYTGACLSRGRTKMDSGDFEGAMADFRTAIKIDPKWVDPFRLIDDIILHGLDVYRITKPKFEEWSKEVRREFGAKAEPLLNNVYLKIDIAKPKK